MSESTVRRRQRWPAPWGAAVLCVLLLAACGESSGGESSQSSSSGGGSTSDPASKLTKDPIVVQTISPQTGPGTRYPESFEVAQRFADRLNSEGGIDGHPLKITTCDDKQTAAGAADCARQAVKDKVAANVGTFTSFGDQVGPILNAAKIPFVGSAPATDEASLTLPNAYTTSPLNLTAPIAAAYAAKRCKNVDLTIVQWPGTKLVTNQFKTALAAYGKSVRKVTEFAFTTKDYAPVAAQVAGADCAHLMVGPDTYPGWLAAEAKVGVNPRLLSIQGGLEPMFAKYDKRVTGQIVINALPLLSDKSWDTYREVFASELETQEGREVYSNQVSSLTWLAYVVFAEVAKKAAADGGPVTAAAWKKTADQQSKLSTGGLTPDLDFTTPFDVKGFERLFNRTSHIAEFQADGSKKLLHGFIDAGPLLRGQPAGNF